MRYRSRILWLTCLFFLTGCNYSCAEQLHTDQAQQPAGSAHLRKLSPDLSMAYKKDDPDRMISVLVKTTSPLTPEQRKELSRQNITIGTVAGNICTANMRLKEVPVLAEKPYVQSLELSKKLKLLDKTK